ncbi:MAG: GGDEF domain-containing protein [Peptococcaceae bacterium]|nr:GGDEF domain-containing protein [Peptococcaceae bacterium]
MEKQNFQDYLRQEITNQNFNKLWKFTYFVFVIGLILIIRDYFFMGNKTPDYPSLFYEHIAMEILCIIFLILRLTKIRISFLPNLFYLVLLNITAVISGYSDQLGHGQIIVFLMICFFAAVLLIQSVRMIVFMYFQTGIVFLALLANTQKNPILLNVNLINGFSFTFLAIFVSVLFLKLFKHDIYAKFHLETLYRKYKEDSLKDHLTGLNNIRKFEQEIKKLHQDLIDKLVVSILLIDIDHFKNINDSFGHKSGDKVLEDLSKLLLNVCRNSDIISRNGGEEFSVLLHNIPENEALEIAERIRETIEKNEFNINEEKIIKITVSIGVATYPDTVDNINLLFEKADSALYTAKKTGRNKVVLAS